MKTEVFLNLFHFRWTCIFTLAFVCCYQRTPVANGADPVTLSGVSVGLDGNFQVGKWTPVTADLNVTEPVTVIMEISAIDPDGYHTSFPTRAVSLDKVGQHQIQAFFIAGRLRSDINVTIRDAQTSQVLIEQSYSTQPTDLEQAAYQEANVLIKPVLTQGTPIILMCKSIAGFDELGKTDDSVSGYDPSAEAKLRLVQSESIKVLPDSARSLDSCHTIVLSADYQKINARQNAAIQTWVRNGGHLLLNLGGDADAFRTSKLSSWVPIEIDGTMNVRQFTRLESFSGQNMPVRFRGQTTAARIRQVQGVAVVTDRAIPMIVALPYGFGRITCVAYDFNRAPLSRWRPLVNVCERLIFPQNQGRDQRDRGSVTRNKLAQSGINDLATQLHAIMDNFPGLRRYTSWSIMGWMLLYLLFLGPIDYLLVHRLLKRPQLTWLTFPILVLVATGLAMGTAQANNGHEAIENQIDLVDVEANSIRINSWFTIYSNETCLTDIRLVTPDFSTGTISSPGVTAATAEIRWAGIPEAGYGGMYRSTGMELTRPAYNFDPSMQQIENLPLAIWSTKSLQSEYNRLVTGMVASQLESPGASQIRGSFEHRLPVPITDWFIAYGSRVFQPKTRIQGDGQYIELQPGQACTLSITTFQQRDLKSFLTGTRQRIIEKENSTRDREIIEEELNYNRLDRDPDKLMRMISFHDAAGGTRYTGLSNQVLQNLDFSADIRLDRAVLFGRLSDHPNWSLGYQRDGQTVEPDRKDIFVRLVLPVNRLTSQMQSLPDFDEARNKNKK